MLCKYLLLTEEEMCEKIHAIMAWETLYFPSFFFYHDHQDHDNSHCFSSQDLVDLLQSNLIIPRIYQNSSQYYLYYVSVLITFGKAQIK